MAAAALLLMSCGVSAGAQEIHFGVAPAATAKHQNVELLDDAVAVKAGKPQDVELRFRVLPGQHINSHQPKDETLMPTTLKVNAVGGFKVLGETFPQGTPFRLNIGAGETLSVYQGEFRVGLRVIVPRGQSTLTGALHYQACDTASCYPPRVLPVKVAVTGN